MNATLAHPTRAASSKPQSIAPQISFLVPVYNGLEFTRECLRTLSETVNLTFHEVIIIDDASTDGTAEFLETLSPPFHIFRNAEHSNYAASMNRGATAARGEILCLLNNDLVFKSGWLEPMFDALHKNSDAGFIGNVQFNPRTKKFDHLGIVFGDDAVPRHFGRHFIFRPFRGVTEWKAVTAACCLIRRSVFLEAGGFDESFQNGCEDIDLCLRLQETGHRHFVVNSSVIDHHVSSSEGRKDFDSRNEQILVERWRERILRLTDTRERRRYAANYALRFLSQPWRYNGPRLWQSLVTLLKSGR